MTCWVMTTGEAGMRSQALGLAERLDLSLVEKTVKLNAPWRWLPGHLAPFAFGGLDTSSDPLTPPWPDLLITCGRRSVALSIAIKKASGGKTFTVHIQDPRVPTTYFDMVAAPRHDGIKGVNAYDTLGALHKVTAAKLSAARTQFEPLFAPLTKPLISVLIGGNSKSYQLTSAIAKTIAAQLRGLVQQGNAMAITFSQRTGAKAEAIIRNSLEDLPVWIWDGVGDNPYLGMLAWADYLVVTGDSASMVSEAAFTGKPVLTIDLAGGSKKFDAFHAMMQNAGYSQKFDGTLPAQGDDTHPPLDETGRIADIIREKLAAHKS